MFTNKEVKDYSDLLHSLNQKENTHLLDRYHLAIEAGGYGGIPHFKLLEDSTAEAYIIWVRGTDFKDPNDILINIQTTPIKFYNGFCHRGYFFAGYAITLIIRQYLLHGQYNKIICLGHSLGGAVSSVVTTILQKGSQGPIRYVNRLQHKFQQGGIRALIFGTPPLFSVNISIETQDYISNIILTDDIVPKLGGLFNSLTKLQLRIVTILMYDRGSLIFEGGRQQLIDYYFSYFQRVINTDQLPGNIIFLDPSKGRAEPATNKRNIENNLELIGIFHHVYNNYYEAMQMITQMDDNDLFIEENIKMIQEIQTKVTAYDRVASIGFNLMRVAFIGGSKATELALKGGSKVAKLAFRTKTKAVELADKGNEIADEIALKRETDAVEFALKGAEILGEVFNMIPSFY